MTATTSDYLTAPNRSVGAATGIDYAYREVGDGPPLVLLQHFRGNLDNWDPALVDGLAADRRVVTFDNVGVGSTSGMTPRTIEAMARGAISFIETVGLRRVDLLGGGSRVGAAIDRRRDARAERAGQFKPAGFGRLSARI